jgi:hypothetical protein
MKNPDFITSNKKNTLQYHKDLEGRPVFPLMRVTEGLKLFLAVCFKTFKL